MEQALFDESIDASDEHIGKKKQKERHIPSRSARHTGESKRRKVAAPAKAAVGRTTQHEPVWSVHDACEIALSGVERSNWTPSIWPPRAFLAQ